MTNSKRKGAVGERELAAKLTELFGQHCRRGQQYNGLEGDDVVGLDGIHIECKRTERLQVHASMEQSMRDAKHDEIPIVCHRANRRDWIVILRLDDLPQLIDKLIEFRR